ncbi:hypothetical protein KQI52_00415 [bacterium]|nr:hypothetical protein [bacterium]
MPPRPIDERNVYQKTLWAQREADLLHDGMEREKHIRQKMMAEEQQRRAHEEIEVTDERDPLKRTRKDAQREKRRKDKDSQQQDEEKPEAKEDDEQQDLRRRTTEDDKGKGDKLDVRG